MCCRRVIKKVFTLTTRGATMKKLACSLLTIIILFTISCEIGLGSSVDTEPPSLSIAADIADKVIRDDFVLRGTYSDDGTVSKLSAVLKRTDKNGEPLEYDGVIIENLKKRGSGTWTIDIPAKSKSIKDGTYQADVSITDALGRTTVQSTIFTIDNTPPIIILTRPSTALESTSSDTYGQKFTIEGAAAEKNDIGRMEIQLYTDEACTIPAAEEPIVLTNVPSSIEVEAANYDVEQAKYIYKGITQSFFIDVPTDGEGREFYYKLFAYDGAKRYLPEDETPSDDDLKGNRAEYFFLQKDIYENIQQYYTITEMYSILSDNYFESSTDRAAEAPLPEQVKTDLLDDSKYQRTIGKFNLNPKNNPTYTVTGRSPLASLTKSSFENDDNALIIGGQLIIEVSPGLDGHILKEDTIKIYTQQYTFTDGTPVVGTPVEITQYERKESGNTYKYITNINREDGYEIGKFYTVYVEGKDVKNNTIVSAGNNPYGFRLISNGRAPVINLSEPEDVTTYTNKKQIFKGTAEVELGIPVVNVYKGIVSESTKVKTIEFTEEQGYKEGSDFVFDFTYEDETFDGKTGKSKFLFETDLGGQKSTQPQERTVIYDMDLPTISITKPTTAKKFNADGSEEAGAYLNGEVEFTVMLNDKGGSGLDSESNKPKWEIFDASNKTTPLASGFISETTGETISINTAESKYNGKTIIFRVTAWDVAGNKKSTEADDSKYTFIVDQTTDIPFICEDTDYGKVKFSLNSVDAYMAQRAEAKFGTVKKSSTLKFKVYEDDGTANITILKKKLNITKNNDGTYTSDWTNDLSAFDEEEAFEEEIDTPNKLVTMNTYSFPSTDAECGYYEYVIIATDKSDKSASPRNTIKGPFIVRITKDEASITVEKDFDYRNENSEFTNTITIIPSEGPYKLYRQVVVDGEQYNDTSFGNTDIAEYKLIKDNIPDTTLIHEDKLKLSTYAHDKNITVYYRVIDGASQASASQSVVLKYDNAAFAPEIKAPIAGKTGKQALTETTQISARLRDDRAGVEKVFHKFTHNSNPGTKMGTAGGYESEPASNGSFALDPDFVEGLTAGTNQLCEGKWFFHIYTEDGAGNVSAVETREFDIDMKSPVITTTLDDTAISTDAVYNKNAAYTFKFKITETNALDATEPVIISVKKGTTPISFTIKDGTTEVSDLTQIAAGKDYTIEIPDADGLYTYTITVKDFVGKDAKVERVVQYDTTPPVAKHEIDTKQKDLYFRIGDYSNDAGVPDVGGKYSGGTYGNALTIQIRGYFDDEGSGINKFYYMTFNNREVMVDSTKATGSEPVEESETIYFNSPDVLKNYVIANNTGTFFPLDEPEEKNVDYNTAAGKATKAIVSNYKTTIKGFQEGKNYLVLVAEDNVGNTAVDYAEIEGVGEFYCYSLNVDITSPSIPTKEDENLFTNIDSTNTDSNVHFYIEGTVSDKPNKPNGSAGLASVVFTRDGGTGSIELKASDLTEPTTEDISAVPDDSTLKHWKVDVKSLLPSSGTAIISAKVTDNAGYEVSVPVANITVDRTAPEVIINSPVADAKIGATNLIINGTASDGNGAGISSDKLKVYYTKSESLGTATAAPASTDFGTAIAEKWVELGEVTSGAIWTYTKPDINATETIASNNENTSLYFMVSAKDKSGTGNVGYSSPRKVTVDRKAPVFVSGKFNGNETTSTDAWINNRTVNLEGSFTDTHAGVEGSGVTSIFYKFYETGDETSLANAVEKVIPTTDGSYNTNVNLDDSISNASFELWAKDSAGNISAKKTYLIKVDYTAPNLSASYYKKGTDSVTATGNTVYIKNQDGGTNFVLYGNYNDGSNQSGVKDLVFKKNGTAFTPTVTYSATAIEDGTIPDDSTYAAYNNTAAAGYNSWKATFILNETARITVEGEDNAGNKATAVSAIDVTFDNTNPVLSNLNFTETKGGVTKDVYSKDDQYYTNHTVSGKTFKISGIATDNVGVESVSLTVTNNATTPVSITPPMEGTTNNWSFTPDMSSWTTGVTGATAKVTVKDKAGNSAEKSLTIVFDTIPPSVDASKIVTPDKDQTESDLFKFEGGQDCISHGATVSGLDKVELLFTTTSGTPEATATPNATASIADNGTWSSTIEFSKVTAFSTQGEKWLWVRAYDKAGNASAWTSKSFVYDKSVPTIQFTGTTNPAAGSYKKAGFTLTVKAEDTYGIQAFDVIYPIALSTQPAGWPTNYYTDASGTSAASTFAAGTYYFKQTETVTAATSVNYSKEFRVRTDSASDATLLPDGNDTITIIAKDKAGKTATISRTIHVDTVAPEYNELQLQNKAYALISSTWFNNTSLSLSGSYKDINGSGLKTIHYKLVDAETSVTLAETSVTPIYDEEEDVYNYSTNISDFSSTHLNTLEVWAEDNAENESTPHETCTVKVDDAIPEIVEKPKVGSPAVSPYPFDKEYPTNGSVEKPFEFDVIEASSGIDGTHFTIKVGSTTLTLVKKDSLDDADITENTIVVGGKGADNKYPVKLLLGTDTLGTISGNLSILVTVKDGAENTSAPVVIGSLNLDNTKPIPSFTSPANNATVNKTIEVSGKIKERNDLASVVLTAVSGSNTINYSYPAPETETATAKSLTFDTDEKEWKAVINTTALYSLTSSQACSLTITATDEAGNEAIAVNRAITIDQNTDRPVIEFTDITLPATEGNTIGSSSKSISFKITDDDGNLGKNDIGNVKYQIVDSTHVYANTDERWINTKLSVDDSGIFKISDIEEGEQSIYFKITDKAQTPTTFISKTSDVLVSPKLYDGSTYYSTETALKLKVDYNPPSIKKVKYLILENGSDDAYAATDWEDYSTSSALVGGPDSSTNTVRIALYTYDKNSSANDQVKLYIPYQTGDPDSDKKKTPAAADQYKPFKEDPYYIYSFTKQAAAKDGLPKTDSTISGNNKYELWVSEDISVEDFISSKRECKISATEGVSYGEETVVITIDNTAPTFKLISPKATKALVGDVEINGTISDNNGGIGATGVNTIKYYLPTKAQADFANPSESLDWVSTSYTGNLTLNQTLTSEYLNDKIGFSNAANAAAYNGFKTENLYQLPVWLRLEDDYGNFDYDITQVSILYNADADTPVVDITSPTHDSGTNNAEYVTMGGTIKIQGTAEDGVNNIAAVNLQIDLNGDGEYETNAVANIKALSKNVTWTYELDVMDITDNTRVKVQAQAVDVGGLSSAWSETLVINVENTKPNIRLFGLRRYESAITDAANVDSYQIQKEYNKDMDFKTKDGFWYIYGEAYVKTGNHITEIKAIDYVTFTWTRGETTTGTSTGDGLSWSGDSGVHQKFLIPISKTAENGEWETTIAVKGFNGTEGKNEKEETISLTIDNTDPAFTETNSTNTGDIGTIKLRRTRTQATDLYEARNKGLDTEKTMKNENGKASIAGGFEENGSGFKRLAFYLKRDSTIYNVMETSSNTTTTYTLNSEKLPVTSLTGTVAASTSSTYATFTPTTASTITGNKNIRVGGLIKIGYEYRTIKAIDPSTGAVSFEPECDSKYVGENQTAEFVYALVVDRSGEEANEDGTEKTGDGDGMYEHFTSTNWEANINTSRIPDGPIEVHCVMFDEAGNTSYGWTKTFISNNAPRITTVQLGTDLNADNKYDLDSEFQMFYKNADNSRTSGTQVWNLDAYVTGSTTNYWTAKKDLVVIPEFVGGNGDIYYAYTKETGSDGAKLTEAAPVTTNEASKLKEQILTIIKSSDTTNSTNGYTLSTIAGTGNTNGALILENDKTKDDDDNVLDTVGSISTTAGDYLVGTVTNAGINVYRFSFRDSTNNASVATDTQWCVLNITMKQDLADGTAPTGSIKPFYWNGKGAGNSSVIYANGIAKGHIELPGDLPATTFNATSGEYDKNPKVSGKIKIEGEAFDETMLKEINLSFDGNSVKATFTPGTGWGYATNSDDFTLAIVDTNGPTQSGHSVTWTYTVDTSKITGVANVDREIRVEVKDYKGDNPNTVGTTQTGGDDGTGNMTPYYKVDVVPYITGLGTRLDDAYSAVTSVFNRSANGNYPVMRGETGVKLYGFNLNGASTTVKFNGTSVGTVTAGTTADYVTFTVPAAAKSGVVDITVSSVASLNNSNSATAEYNLEPNGINNDTLNDDRSVYVWGMDNIFNQNVSVRYPMFKVGKDANQSIVFSYDRGGTTTYLNKNKTEYKAGYSWTQWYDTAVAIDTSGNLFGLAQNGDSAVTNSVKPAECSSLFFFPYVADNRNVFTYSRHKSGGDWVYDNFDQDYAFAWENTANNTSFNPNRVLNPKLIAVRGTNSTTIYSVYYDSTDSAIKFRTGTSSGNNNASNSIGNYSNGTNGSASGAQVLESGNSAGEYASVGVIPTGATDAGTVVVCWNSGNSLKYSYYKKGNNNTWSWSTAIIIDDDYAGEYCDLAVDAAGGIHIAYYRAGNKLKYAYLSSYNDTTPDVCMVDSYLSVGENISIETSSKTITQDGVTRYVPYISYYSSAIGMAKVAWPVSLGTNESSGNANTFVNGADSDKFTGAWEVQVIPTALTTKLLNYTIGVGEKTNGTANSVMLGYGTKSGLQTALLY